MNYPLIKPRYYYSLLLDVLRFILRPSPQRELNKPFKNKVYDTLALYLLKFLFLLPVLLFFTFVYDPKNVQEVSMFERFSPAMLVLLGGFILPLAEEIGFRLSLVFRPIYLALSASVLVYYVLSKLVFDTKISMLDDSFPIRIMVSLAIGLILYPILSRQPVTSRLSAFWETHFRSIFYITSITFAWMHINKYEINELNLLLMPILTLPQMYSAIIYGYTRVKFGFAYPLIMHMSTNTLALSLAMLFPGD